MLKKSVSIALAILMLIGVFAVVPLSAGAETSGDFNYKLLENGTAEITAYKGSSSEIIIPSEIDGYTVTAIGEKAFDYLSVTNVTIPNSVISIGERAFDNCYNLTVVTIPDSVTEINDYAFNYCSHLTELNIGNSVTAIGKRAFYSCWSIKSVIIPDSVQSIGDEAFGDCSSLRRITLPDGVELGNNVFKGTEYDPESNFSGDYQYKTENGITTITYYFGKEKNLNIPSTLDGNEVSVIGKNAFSNCGDIESVTIPNTIIKIDDWAFDSCNNLYDVKIPDSVRRIGECAFQGCEKLSEITIPDSVYSIGNWAFHLTDWENNFKNDDYVYIGKVLYEVHSASYKCEIKYGTIGIADQAFSLFNGKNVSEVTLPNTLKHIGKEAFYNCYNLTSVIAPASVDSIDMNAFAMDVKINQITFYGETGSTIQRFATSNGYNFEQMSAEQKADTEGDAPATEPASTEPVATHPAETIPRETEEIDIPDVTNPPSTEPPATAPVVTEPAATQPSAPAPAAPKVTAKKTNPIKVTVKTKTVKLKKLKKKAQKVKAITVKNTQGKVTYKLVKSGISKKIRKFVKINSKGVIIIKKWKKAKKGTYKIKVKVTAAGTSAYNAKTITKTVKVKIK